MFDCYSIVLLAIAPKAAFEATITALILTNSYHHPHTSCLSIATLYSLLEHNTSHTPGTRKMDLSNWSGATTLVQRY